MKDVLLPCPFCGSEPHEAQYPTLHVIECKRCGIQIAGKGIMSDAPCEPVGDGTVRFTGPGTLGHQEELRKRWNTRA